MPPPKASRVADRLALCAESLLNELCERFPIGYRPEIAWRSLRVTAGSADHRRRRIALSVFLLTDEGRVQDTLVHEYAHLLAVARAGEKAAGHGPDWKRAMSDLGSEPKRTHDYPVCRNASVQRVAYTCDRCGAVLVRRRRLPRRRRFVHAGCGGLIRFAGAGRVTPEPDAP